jgi:hypothetical protein
MEAHVSVTGSPRSVDQATTDALSSLALGDSGFLGEAMNMREQLRADSSLDSKSFALVQLALDAGASPREILGVLTAVAPQTGMARVVAAAPEIMLALGLELPAGTDG